MGDHQGELLLSLCTQPLFPPLAQVCRGCLISPVSFYVIFVHLPYSPEDLNFHFEVLLLLRSSLEVHTLWIPFHSCPAELRGLRRSRVRTLAQAVRLIRGLPPFPPAQLIS